MANTYSQLNIHCVFAVQGRQNIITKNFREALHRYMAGILRNDGAYPLAVGGWQDHVHTFYELPVTTAVADQMRMLKASSSKWINDKGLLKGKFHWQEGYGAFSHSRSQRDSMIKYIMHQEEHHRLKTFREEYLGFLREFDIPYDERYLFEFYE